MAEQVTVRVPDTREEDRFARHMLLVGFLVLTIGVVFGLLQIITRAPYWPKLEGRELYYRGLTAHGVFNAIAFTLVYAMGFSAYVVPRVLGVNLHRGLLRLAEAMSCIGCAMAALAILLGKANVLYTFYAPMLAHPAFYLGAALLILGSWVFAAAVFLAYREWRRSHPDDPIPLTYYGVATTFIVWLIATTPLVFMVIKDLVPMSLVGKPVDVLESRTYFWWFGHALVYFWLLPAVVLWYYYIPKRLGVPLFSTKMAKVALALFIVASAPVGLHHQFTDPGISPGYKYVQTIITMVVAAPSMLTAFNLIATMERAGRLRGGTGALGWLRKLPWRDPVFLGLVTALIIFGNGGITGIINASYQLNNVVHNTSWVVGHFHTTVGGAVALTFAVSMYLFLRELFGREIVLGKLSRAVPLLWLAGITIFSLAYYAAGIAGAPRRTMDMLYGGRMPSSWALPLQLGAVGGIVYFAAIALFYLQFYGTLLKGKRLVPPPKSVFLPNPHNPHPEKRKGLLDRMALVVGFAILLNLLAYIGPLYELYSRGLVPVPPRPP